MYQLKIIYNYMYNNIIYGALFSYNSMTDLYDYVYNILNHNKMVKIYYNYKDNIISNKYFSDNYIVEKQINNNCIRYFNKYESDCPYETNNLFSYFSIQNLANEEEIDITDLINSFCIKNVELIFDNEYKLYWKNIINKYNSENINFDYKFHFITSKGDIYNENTFKLIIQDFNLIINNL